MTDSGPRRIGVSIELKPHAYDPVTNPELFEGVLPRRVIAFMIDLIILSIPVLILGVFVAAATIATLGLAAILFALLSPLFWPLIVIWAVCYYGFTLRQPGVGDHRHAHHGSGDAHLVRLARLFRARRRARGGVLDRASPS